MRHPTSFIDTMVTAWLLSILMLVIALARARAAPQDPAQQADSRAAPQIEAGLGAQNDQRLRVDVYADRIACGSSVVTNVAALLKALPADGHGKPILVVFGGDERVTDRRVGSVVSELQRLDPALTIERGY